MSMFSDGGGGGAVTGQILEFAQGFVPADFQQIENLDTTKPLPGAMVLHVAGNNFYNTGSYTVIPEAAVDKTGLAWGFFVQATPGGSTGQLKAYDVINGLLPFTLNMPTLKGNGGTLFTALASGNFLIASGMYTNGNSYGNLIESYVVNTTTKVFTRTQNPEIAGGGGFTTGIPLRGVATPLADGRQAWLPSAWGNKGATTTAANAGANAMLLLFNEAALTFTTKPLTGLPVDFNWGTYGGSTSNTVPFVQLPSGKLMLAEGSSGSVRYFLIDPATGVVTQGTSATWLAQTVGRAGLGTPDGAAFYSASVPGVVRYIEASDTFGAVVPSLGDMSVAGNALVGRAFLRPDGSVAVFGRNSGTGTSGTVRYGLYLNQVPATGTVKARKR